MTAIKVDFCVPVPEDNARNARYPWDDLNVGDSFFVADATSNRLLSAARCRRGKGERYTARACTENGIKGARIWRIE